jgi:hypothetical protein
MNVLDSLLSSLAAEFEDDYVGLWTIVKQVRRTFPSARPMDIRRITLWLILLLLEAKLIQAGFPTKDGREFETLNLKPYGVVSRIASEWKEPERYPAIGEVMWFTARSSEPRSNDSVLMPIRGSKEG